MDYDDALISKITLLQSDSIVIKIKNMLSGIRISAQDIRHMRTVLKTEFKPLFANYIMSEFGNKSGDNIQRLTLEFYDENIDRLPKDMIIDFYMDYELIKKYPEVASLQLHTLFFRTSLSYSLNGWFMGKVAGYRFK
jgi:hypothetical protein